MFYFNYIILVYDGMRDKVIFLFFGLKGIVRLDRNSILIIIWVVFRL